MMLREKMYVRCPIIEINHIMDSRDFIVGQIVEIDELSEMVTVLFKDPFGYRAFYDDIPEKQTFPLSMVSRCEFYKGTKVKYKGKTCHVLKVIKSKEGLYEYYVQVDENKSVIKVKEESIEADFNEGWISPKNQLKNYEFQNPSWYLGRTVVNRMNKVLDNSVLGFKELAGCKIFLMPHQLNTVMRCNQEKVCRFMLADEVGMGKTIEAAAVLKLFLLRNSSKKVLIIVPDALVEQWRVELFFKFDINIGTDRNGNEIFLAPFSEVNVHERKGKYDFVIMDEVHRLLQDNSVYRIYHNISMRCENLLLLSATPMQKKTGDFLALLRLLEPSKYDAFDEKSFSELVDKQKSIINQVMGVLDDIDDLRDEISECDDDIHTDRQCLALYDDILEGLEEIGDLIEDDEFSKLYEAISNKDDDLGLQGMFIAVSYVCDNYQLEKNIIRNRRNILNSDEYESHTRPVRHLKAVLSYQCSSNEYNIYQELMNIVENDNADENIINNYYRPLFSAYSSSASAFYTALKNNNYKRITESQELLEFALKWKTEEEYAIEELKELVNNPDEFNHRFLVVLDYLDQELYKEKIVIFTSFSETFSIYKNILLQYYDAAELAFFNSNMSADDLELNVYRFQNDKECRIMLCDKSGGEGRNFQIADYIIHIDIPWDANEIEQRIGRLDRLERNSERPDVNSVVVIAEESLEEQLLEFWNKGLNVFKESLSGLEIVLEDINKQMYSAIAEDIRYGLYNAVPKILETTTVLKKEIKREQRFDTIGYLYKPMNRQIVRLIRYYAQNENDLFSSTMLNWASLAGFRPSGTENIVRFAASSFSLNSARNTLLIPPDWTAYLQSKQTEFANRISNLYSKYKATNISDGKEIKGTFDRKIAIDSDYLHFFAPGDDIFDCIVGNAIRSSKGQSTAFAMKSGINWKGFVYTYSVEPNDKILLENGISMTEIAYFRNFLSAEMAVIPVALDNYRDVPSKVVLEEYERIIKMGYRATHSCLDHLGKRGKSGSGFLNIAQRYNVPNIEWFRETFPKDFWESMVDATYEISRKMAISELSRKSHLKELKEEIQRIVAAKVSSDVYFRRDTENIEAIKRKYDIIAEALRKPQITLESACFVWMVK